MNHGWDIALACEMCHKQHRAIMPNFFYIWLPLALEEAMLPSNITNVVMDQIFIIHSPTVRRAIWHIISEELLCPSTPLLFYPSQLLSIFLSNAMDLMQSPKMLHVLAQKVILPHFLADNKLIMAMQTL